MPRQSVANWLSCNTFLFMGISRRLSILAGFHKEPKNSNYREAKNKQDESDPDVFLMKMPAVKQIARCRKQNAQQGTLPNDASEVPEQNSSGRGSVIFFFVLETHI